MPYAVKVCLVQVDNVRLILTKHQNTSARDTVLTCASAICHDARAVLTVSTQVEEVRLALTKHQNILQSDSNWGLANQAMASIYTRNIQRLTQTFVTLSLKDIADQVSLPDAQAAKTKVHLWMCSSVLRCFCSALVLLLFCRLKRVAAMRNEIADFFPMMTGGRAYDIVSRQISRRQPSFSIADTGDVHVGRD